MDAHMNKLLGSKHSKHSSSLPAWLHHVKCYSVHIEHYNENITLGERSCAPSKGWQMDGSGNMLQHPRPATTLAEHSEKQVSITGKLTLPTLTQLFPGDSCSHWLGSAHVYVIIPYSFISCSIRHTACKQHRPWQLVPAQPVFTTVCLTAILQLCSRTSELTACTRPASVPAHSLCC